MARHTRRDRQQTAVISSSSETSSRKRQRAMQSAKPWQRFALLIVLALGGFALTGLSGQKGAPVATAFANDRITPVAAQAAVPVTLAPDTDVAMFTPRNGQWPSASLKDVKPGGEFIYQDHLYRVTDSGTVEMVPDVDVSKLPDADRAFDKSNHRFPEAADVLMVLDKDMKFTHHAVLGTLKPGIRACFQGKAYELRAGRTAGTMDIADTGIVSAPRDENIPAYRRERRRHPHRSDDPHRRRQADRPARHAEPPVLRA